MTLPTDITRCHEATCPERHDCRRWLERESGTSHARSCFPYDEPIDLPCPLRIPTT